MGKRLLAAAMLLLMLCGCAPAQPKPEATDPPAAQPSAPAESTAPGSSQPTETQAPAINPGNADSLHCGMRRDGTFTSGTLFIGDSLTHSFVRSYLMAYGYLGEAKYMAVNGAPLSRFFSSQILYGEGSVYSPEFEKLTYSEAVALMGEDATAVYLMLGTNSSTTATMENYLEVVDAILEVCPNATVHLQLIPFSTSNVVDYEFVNEQLRLTWEHYQNQGICRVMLVDTYTFIGQGLTPDGVHLTNDGLDRWYTALAAHRNNNDIPE